MSGTDMLITGVVLSAIIGMVWIYNTISEFCNGMMRIGHTNALELLKKHRDCIAVAFNSDPMALVVWGGASVRQNTDRMAALRREHERQMRFARRYLLWIERRFGNPHQKRLSIRACKRSANSYSRLFWYLFDHKKGVDFLDREMHRHHRAYIAHMSSIERHERAQPGCLNN